MKVPLVAPAAILSVDGMVTVTPLATFPSVTDPPPLGAAADNVTVHVEDAGPCTVAGVQERALGAGMDRLMVTAAVVPVGVSSPADGDAAAGSETPMIVDDAEVVLEIRKLAVATVPFPMGVVFIPCRIQVYSVAEEFAQLRDLPADVPADPTLTPVTLRSDGVYVNVHCKAADCCPFET